VFIVTISYSVKTAITVEVIETVGFVVKVAVAALE
jgi:hypothetical protein